MIVTRTSIYSGLTREMDLPITQEQLDRYKSGLLLLQEAFPHLSTSQREFIRSGMNDQEWNEIFGDEE